MARLDRLAPVKEVAQIGAVIGREFSHELLAAVRRASGTQLQAALDQLVSSELVFRRGAPPEATYTFKHSLVQDAAYQSLLKSKRQQLHARIAEALGSSASRLSARPSRKCWPSISPHAGLAERAIPYWRRAGELAAGRSANLEAVAHLSKGLELIETLPNATEQLGEELALRLAIGGPLIATKGNAAPEVERTYSRAWSLCDQLGRSADLFPVLRGLWNYHLVRGELQRAHDLAERLVALAEEQGAPIHRALAGVLEVRRCSTSAGLATRLQRAKASRSTMGSRPGRILLTSYSTRSAPASCAGCIWHGPFGTSAFPMAPCEKVEAGLALAQRLAHVGSLAVALICAALLHNLRREFAVAQRRAEAAIEIVRKYGVSQWLGRWRSFAGALLWSASVSRRRESGNFGPGWPPGTGLVARV